MWCHITYREKRNQAKRAVRDANVSADERCSKKKTVYFPNKMRFWKEVQMIRKETSGNEQRVKLEHGAIFFFVKDAVKKR